MKIIESLPQLGGQLAALYPEKYIYDVAGFPKVRAQELIDNLTEQALYFNPTVCLEQMVENLEIQENGIIRLTTNKEEHFTKTVILTAGNGAFQPRKIELPEAKKYETSNLHYFIDNLEKFRNKKVLVCGGGDSAVDWALMLEPIAKQVTLVHRRDKFRAHEHSVTSLMKSTVRIKTPFMPTALHGDGKQIDAIRLQHVKEGTVEKIEIDDVIVNYGFLSFTCSNENLGS